jgi:hypothetical protein
LPPEQFDPEILDQLEKLRTLASTIPVGSIEKEFLEGARLNIAPTDPTEVFNEQVLARIAELRAGTEPVADENVANRLSGFLAKVTEIQNAQNMLLEKPDIIPPLLKKFDEDQRRQNELFEFTKQAIDLGLQPALIRQQEIEMGLAIGALLPPSEPLAPPATGSQINSNNIQQDNSTSTTVNYANNSGGTPISDAAELEFVLASFA